MKNLLFILTFLFATGSVYAQSRETVEFNLSGEDPRVSIYNNAGKTQIIADENQTEKVTVIIESPDAAGIGNDVTIKEGNDNLEIAVLTKNKRFDITIRVPARGRLKIESETGEVVVKGNIKSAEVKTETGTIYADIPLDSVEYKFLWTETRPRVLSDAELNEPEEKAAGKYVVSGKLGEADKKNRAKSKVQSPKSEAEESVEEETSDEETTATRF